MYVCVHEYVHRYVCEMCVHMCECVYVCMYACTCVLASDMVTYLVCHSSLHWVRKELHAFLYVVEAHAVHSRHTVHYAYCKRLLASVLRLYIRRIHHKTMNYLLHIYSEHYRAPFAYCVLCTMFDDYCMCHHVCGKNLYACITVHTVCNAVIALYIITLSVKHHTKLYACVVGSSVHVPSSVRVN